MVKSIIFSNFAPQFNIKLMIRVRQLFILALLLMAVCMGCQWQAEKAEEHDQEQDVVIERYDRIESIYLSMADFAALHQMRTDYPVQTRTLIENVLQLGPVNDPEINNRLLVFFQDSTLQALVAEVERQYKDVGDLNKQLTNAFRRLSKLFPEIQLPHVYTQIGSLDQSIVVTDSLLGISLDKYLGADHPIYLRYGYTEQQRSMMTREYIVPDCLGFYLLSLYPLTDAESLSDEQHLWHMSKIQSVVNQVMGTRIFSNEYIEKLDDYMKSHPEMSTAKMLLLDSI